MEPTMPGPIDLADIAASTASPFEGLPTTRTLQLKKYETDPWPCNDGSTPRPPTTPSEWFSKHFPQQAAMYGCPFIELKQTVGVGMHTIDPLAINTDFFGAILGGDKKLKHSVVYVENEMQFYYYEPLEKMYRPASEDKLGNLM